MRKLNQKGVVPVLFLIAALGLVGFLLVSSSADFKDNLFSTLFPKRQSQALTANINPSGPTDYVAYWNMDDAGPTTVADSVNTSNGSAVNGPLANQAGKFNTAWSFDGINDYVSSTNSSTLNPANVSVSLWVKFNGSLSADKVLLAKGTSFADRSYWFYENNGIQFAMGGAFSSIIPSSSFTAGQWYHIVGTYDGTNLRIYLNGTQQGTAVTASGVSSTQPLGINAYGNGTLPASSKTIDDVRIYNRALTQSEITSFSGSISAPTPTPIPSSGPITLAGSNQSTYGTWSQTCGSGTNRMLIVTTSEWRGDASSQVSGITYAGAPLTKLGQSYNTATGPLVTMWYKKAPTAGLNTVTATFNTNDIVFGSSCWSNVSQADLSIGGGNYGNSSSPTTNAFYAATGDVVVDGISVLGSQTLNVPDGRPVYAKTARGNARIGHSSKAGSTPTSFIPMSWTNTGGDSRFAMITAVLKPAGTSTPQCIRANPTVSIEPLEQSGDPGQAVTYDVNIINNDSSACNRSTFNIVSELETGWSQVITNPHNFDLVAPGQREQVRVFITSPISATAGHYTFRQKVTNSSNTAFLSSATANYIVTPQNTPTPTPTPTYGTPSVEQSSCNMSLTEGQTISGTVLNTITGIRSNTSYYLSFWTMGSKLGNFQLGAAQTNGPINQSWNSGTFYNNGPATLECRIQTTATGGTTIFSRSVTVNVQN